MGLWSLQFGDELESGEYSKLFVNLLCTLNWLTGNLVACTTLWKMETKGLLSERGYRWKEREEIYCVDCDEILLEEQEQNAIAGSRCITRERTKGMMTNLSMEIEVKKKQASSGLIKETLKGGGQILRDHPLKGLVGFNVEIIPCERYIQEMWLYFHISNTKLEGYFIIFPIKQREQEEKSS